MVLLVYSAAAMPPLPQEIYGTLTIDGKAAQPGTKVTLYDDRGVLCGSHITQYEGIYGLVSCKGDDPSTEIDEGGSNGEMITVQVDGQKYKNLEWQSGRFTNLNISIKTQEKTFYSAIDLKIDLSTIDFSRHVRFAVFFLLGILLLCLAIFMLKRTVQE